MTKGRNTTTITIRVPDLIAERIDYFVKNKGISRNEWLSNVITMAVFAGKNKSKIESIFHDWEVRKGRV